MSVYYDWQHMLKLHFCYLNSKQKTVRVGSGWVVNATHKLYLELPDTVIC